MAANPDFIVSDRERIVSNPDFMASGRERIVSGLQETVWKGKTMLSRARGMVSGGGTIVSDGRRPSVTVWRRSPP
jgi:hypothetical protein